MLPDRIFGYSNSARLFNISKQSLASIRIIFDSCDISLVRHRVNRGMLAGPITNTVYYGCSNFFKFDEYNLEGDNFSYDPLIDSVTLFTNNYLYRNLVYNSADVDSSGALTTGVDYSQEWWGYLTSIQLPGTYHFQTPATNQTPISALLPTNSTQWFYVTPFGHPDTVLDTAKGTETLAFQEHHGFHASDDFVQTNKRGGDPRFR